MSFYESGIRSSERAKVLVIDKDIPATHAMTDLIKNSGMHVAVAHQYDKVHRVASEFMPNIVLMDVGMPYADGYGILKLFASRPGCGIIVVSEQDEESDRIVSLELGADDYIPKVTNSREVMARIRALHRRVRRNETLGGNRVSQDEALFGSVRINRTARTVKTWDGRLIPMTSAEFGLVSVLVQARGEAVSRDTLSETVLRRPWQPDDRSIDQLVFGIRRKLPLDRAGSFLIHSVRGVGYVIRAPKSHQGEMQD